MLLSIVHSVYTFLSVCLFLGDRTHDLHAIDLTCDHPAAFQIKPYPSQHVWFYEHMFQRGFNWHASGQVAQIKPTGTCLFSPCRQAKSSSETSGAVITPAGFFQTESHGWSSLLILDEVVADYVLHVSLHGASRELRSPYRLAERLIQGFTFRPRLVYPRWRICYLWEGDVFSWLAGAGGVSTSVCTSDEPLWIYQKKELIQNQANSSKCQHNYGYWH